MTRETKTPSIPDIRDDNIKEVLRAIKATMEVREGSIGNPLDQGATLRDLVTLNLAEDLGDAGGVGGLPVNPVIPPSPGGYNPGTDFTTPPAPTGLRTRGGFTNVFLEWDGAPYRNHNYTEIWRSQVDNIGTAYLIGTTAANVYADPADEDTTYYYWIRFVSRAAVTGPYNQTTGTVAKTAIDVVSAIAALSEEITNSQLFVDLGTRINVVETGFRQLSQVTATSVSQINTLASVVDGNRAAVQVAQLSVDGVRAQYTVKIDNNGHVSGFGLASTIVNGTPRSAFIVRADRFAIVGANSTIDPLGTLTPTKVPFMVFTTPTVIGGKTYPAGTWIDAAFIANATIDTAQIRDLTADKITTGNLTAAIGITTGRISGGVNTAFSFGSANFGTGFYLGNDSGTYKFRVGSPTYNMTWDGTNLSVTGTINATAGVFRGITVYNDLNQVILSSSGGVNASLLSIANTQVTGLGALATADDVFIGYNVRIYNGVGYQTLNTGDFVNTLSRVSSSNIVNFFQTSAITTAYIGDAAINSAKIADLAVSTAKIADLSVSAAKIADLAVTNAKIGAAAVDTLKIGGNAVTVPSTAGQITNHTSSLPVGWNSGVYNYGTLLNTDREVASTTYSITGMDPTESAGTIMTAYTTLYEGGGSGAVIVTSIYVNGVLNAEVGCTLGESKTNTVVGFVYLPNGTHTISIRIKTNPASGGASSKNLTCVAQVVVNSGKR
jgi:hypothetical protein